jgi:hypothetical protein
MVSFMWDGCAERASREIGDPVGIAYFESKWIYTISKQLDGLTGEAGE